MTSSSMVLEGSEWVREAPQSKSQKAATLPPAFSVRLVHAVPKSCSAVLD